MIQEMLNQNVFTKLAKAHDEVSALCDGPYRGGRRWTMRVPVDLKSDSDVVIGDALMSARNVILMFRNYMGMVIDAFESNDPKALEDLRASIPELKEILGGSPFGVSPRGAWELACERIHDWIKDRQHLTGEELFGRLTVRAEGDKFPLDPPDFIDPVPIEESVTIGHPSVDQGEQFPVQTTVPLPISNHIAYQQNRMNELSGFKAAVARAVGIDTSKDYGTGELSEMVIDKVQSMVRQLEEQESK